MISDSVKQKLASAVVSGCDEANRITSEHVELFAFSKNIKGHIRSSACVPFMVQKIFGNAVKRKENTKDSYSYVELEVDGYLIRIAHEPSSYAVYREEYIESLFPEEENKKRLLTLRYKTDNRNRVSEIWLDGDYASLPIPIELANSVRDDEEYYEAVAENAPAFEPVAMNSKAK